VDARYLGIGLVLVIGIAVVVYGWLADRIDTKRRREALEQAPDRPIPGLNPDAPAPTYVSSPQALQPRPRTVLTEEARTSLQQRLNGAPSMAYGHAASEFVTDTNSGLCILELPWILVANEAVDSIREVLPFLQKASAAGHKVVLVAPAIDEAVLGTLRVNAVSGTLANVAVILPGIDQRRQLSSLVGADPLSRQDLRAGYVPPSSIGTCGTWVSSDVRLWILRD
jgi:hypothetical protein